MIQRGSDKLTRRDGWALAHGLLLVPVTLAFAALVPIIFFLPPMKDEFLTGRDLFVRLAHAVFIAACCVGSWVAYLQEAYRVGVATSALFLTVMIIYLSVMLGTAA